jgi:hypothetical protein
VEIFEDPRNVVGDLTKAPNPSLEEFINVSDPSLTSEGKPPVHNPVFQITTFMQSYMYILYLALSLGVEMEP